MDMKLVVTKQKGDKLVIDLTVEGLRGLISLSQSAQHLGTDVGANREVPVTVLRGNAFAKVNKAQIYTEEEYERTAKAEGTDLSKAQHMQGRFYVDSRRQALIFLIFSERQDPSGRSERVREDMTIGLRESDLQMLLGRALSRIDMSEREQRQAERGIKDRRRGKAGRETRQRVGQLKQELHNAQQRSEKSDQQ